MLWSQNNNDDNDGDDGDDDDDHNNNNNTNTNNNNNINNNNNKKNNNNNINNNNNHNQMSDVDLVCSIPTSWLVLWLHLVSVVAAFPVSPRFGLHEAASGYCWSAGREIESASTGRVPGFCRRKKSAHTLKALLKIGSAPASRRSERMGRLMFCQWQLPWATAS